MDNRRLLTIGYVLLVLGQFRSFALETNFAPDTLWTRLVNIEEYEGIEPIRSIETSDGGYLIGGQARDSLYHYIPVILKLDSGFDVSWYLTFPWGGWGFVRALHETPDGGYLMVAASDSLNMIRLNSAGDILWCRNHHGTDLRDAFEMPDFGHILLALGNLYGIDSSGALVWFTGPSEAWIPSIISKGPGDLYVFAGSEYEEGVEDYGPWEWQYAGIVDESGMIYGEASVLGNFQTVKTLVVKDSSCYLGTGAGSYTWYGQAAKISISPALTLVDYTGMQDPHCAFANRLALAPTPDGGFLVSGYHWRTARFNADGELMWQDDSLVVVPTQFEDLGAKDAFQRSDGTYLLIGNEYVPNEGYRIRLVCIDHDPPKGLTLRKIVPVGFPQVLTTGLNTIEWSSWGFTGDVRIELSRWFANGPWELITESTRDDGEYDIIFGQPTARYCRIKLSSVLDTVESISEQNFTIGSYWMFVTLEEVNNPGIRPDTLDFGEMAYGTNATRTLQVWWSGLRSPRTPLIYSLNTTVAGAFDVDPTCTIPGNANNCQLLVSFQADEPGLFEGSFRLTTNSSYGDTVYGGVNGPFDSSAVYTTMVARVNLIPEAPQLTVRRSADDILLFWDPIYQTVDGFDIADLPLRYFIFYGAALDSTATLIGSTDNWEYVHAGIAAITQNGYYHALTSVDTPTLRALSDQWLGFTAERVMYELEANSLRYPSTK